MGHGHHRQRGRADEYDFDAPLSVPSSDALGELLDFEERHILESDEAGLLAAIDAGERPPANVTYPPRRERYLGYEDDLERVLWKSGVLDVDGTYDPKANHVTPRDLQPEYTIERGGGSSSGRKREVRKQFKGGKGYVVLSEDVPNTSLPRFKITKLTRGERDFYDRRPGLSLDLLRLHVREIIAGDYPRENDLQIRRATSGVADDYVYGLSELEMRVLRVHPGSARAKLIQHAHAVAPERILLLDGETKAA